MTDDPTAWLGDPVGMHLTSAGDVVISVPPAERETVVITLVDAPTIEDPRRRAPDPFVRVNINGARGLRRALGDAMRNSKSKQTEFLDSHSRKRRHCAAQKVP